MKRIAKLVLIDPDDKYLLLYRANHPDFGNDPDLPGGTHEGEESLAETMVREVEEEIKVTVAADDAKELYAGTDYSTHGSFFSLFVVRHTERPEVTLSWEHSTYEWLDRADFLEKVTQTDDSFMKMVHDTVSRH